MKSRGNIERERQKAHRAQAIELLGGKCMRCGITQPLVITGPNNPVRGPGHVIDNRIIRGDRNYLLLCFNCHTLRCRFPDEYNDPPYYGPLPTNTPIGAFLPSPPRPPLSFLGVFIFDKDKFGRARARVEEIWNRVRTFGS